MNFDTLTIIPVLLDIWFAILVIGAKAALHHSARDSGQSFCSKIKLCKMQEYCVHFPFLKLQDRAKDPLMTAATFRVIDIGIPMRYLQTGRYVIR